MEICKIAALKLVHWGFYHHVHRNRMDFIKVAWFVTLQQPAF